MSLGKLPQVDTPRVTIAHKAVSIELGEGVEFTIEEVSFVWADGRVGGHSDSDWIPSRGLIGLAGVVYGTTGPTLVPPHTSAKTLN